VKRPMSNTNVNNDKILNWYGRVSKSPSRGPVSDIWQNNIDNILVPIIYSDDAFNVKLSRVLNTILFSLQLETSIIDEHLDWHISLLRNNGLDVFDMPDEFCAHELEGDKYTRIVNKRRLSPDFVLRLHYLNEIKRHFHASGKGMVFAELGAGYGSLARVIKTAYKDSTYIIFDLPETLYFCASYLTLAFPNAKSLFVEEDTCIQDVQDYDFVFVPVGMEEKFKGLTIDLFMNSRSLGEMPNEIIEKWFRFIQNENTVKYIFMLNRFMTPLMQRHRIGENEASLIFDKYWEILRWEFEPDFERCPYNELTAFPNLLVIAKRVAVSHDEEYYKKESNSILDKVKKQDWYQMASSKDFRVGGFFPNLSCVISMALIRSLPQKLALLIKKATYWRGKTIKAAHIYNVSGRMLAHPILSGRIVDYTKSGTLFNLWESIRLYPNRDNVSAMIKYLNYLNAGRFQQYEEYYYYNALLDNLVKDDNI
jgi:hypothetical protein